MNALFNQQRKFASLEYQHLSSIGVCKPLDVVASSSANQSEDKSKPRDDVQYAKSSLSHIRVYNPELTLQKNTMSLIYLFMSIHVQFHF